MSHKKQHIIPETYLKCFSKEENGKGIHVLHLNNPYKKKIETCDSGDSVFWLKNFYNTSHFHNPKTIELFFGQEIENSYYSIIDKINLQLPFKDEHFKTLLFEWIFYSKLRSPMWRWNFQSIHKERGFDYAIDSKELREEHMQFFSNPDLLVSSMKYYFDELKVKKWKVLICPDNYYWITSDNPGFAIATKKFAQNPNDYVPDSLWVGVQGDSALYYPLTKKFCLEIFPYDQNDDVKRNFGNDNILFEKTKYDMARLINDWTVITSYEKIISSREEELLKYIKKN